MLKNNLLSVSIVAYFLSGCSGLADFFRTPEEVPLSWVIADNRYQLQKASAQILFEEFVKYKALGERTIAFYKLNKADVEVSTSWGYSREDRAAAILGFEPKGEAEQTVTVSKNQLGKMTISYEPVANIPGAYQNMKAIFHKYNKSMYGLLYSRIDSASGGSGDRVFNEQDREIPDNEFRKLCNDDTHCFGLPELDRTHERHYFAYLRDPNTFLQLENEIREYQPPAQKKDEKSNKQEQSKKEGSA